MVAWPGLWGTFRARYGSEDHPKIYNKTNATKHLTLTAISGKKNFLNREYLIINGGCQCF
ncbi:hypothetical protein MKFW12EY_26790 [Methylomonas koyamae]|nr:hypothetical protein MKFW12EY_26790 [Methylomonas koyamae]